MARKKRAKNYDWQFSDKVLNSVLFKRNRIKKFLYNHLRQYPTPDAVQLYEQMVPKSQNQENKH